MGDDLAQAPRYSRTVHPSKQYKCTICSCICGDWRALYVHRQEQHGRGDDLQSVPWQDGEEPWVGPDGSLEENTNRGHILRPLHEGQIRVEYNFPTNDLV